MSRRSIAHFDLIAALCSSGFVEGPPEEFARTPKTMESQLIDHMPFARASPHSVSAEDDSPILIYGRLEASISLYFDGLPADIGRRLRFLQPGDFFSDLPWLASASLVIVVRDFEHMLTNGTLDLLTEIGVPYVWFIDDDFMALHREEACFGFYSKDRVQSFLSRASGLVTTTRALADAHIGLHETVLIWPCVYDRSLARGTRSPTADDLRIGVFGGGFRRQSFLDHAMPAITALGAQIPTAVFAADEIARGSAAPGIVPIAFEPEFRPFVFKWRQLGLHALVHPYGVTGNIANKSQASILAAAYLGAVPIVGDEPAYAGVSEACGVLKAGPSPASWEECLRRVADPAEALDLFGRLDRWCRTAFDPEKARVPFEALARLAAPGGADRAGMRLQQARQSETLRRVLNTTAKARPTMIGRLVRNVRQRWNRGVC